MFLPSGPLEPLMTGLKASTWFQLAVGSMQALWMASAARDVLMSQLDALHSLACEPHS